ncbi:MAG: RNA polymerase sigma factor [Blastocatellia bacterium]
MNDSSAKSRRGWTLTQEALNLLLAMLDTNPEKAWEKYEEIRRKLIKYFEFHRGSPPDVLADKTIDRVARKVADGEAIRDIEAYTMRVAWHIVQEYWRSNETKTISIEGLEQDWPLDIPNPEEKMLRAGTERQEKIRLECMGQCLDKLSPDELNLMRQYQMGEKSKRSENRKKLAEKLGITRLALRLQVYQIRIRLRACLDKCVRRNPVA